ncbi:Hypothetical predicted protein [Mytilus galloprovincialis]|uniref:Uncharacterized protein n=1 Tax=Mytilus galloprovincialis TaxID=29158 RepID=A0A8B6CUQ2_MYTGA|nr:Hypothetical predicted protein [Mytilus galloprovincialis]
MLRITWYLDATHKYLDALFKYLDASHKYLDASHKYLDASHKYLDASHKYLDALFKYLDASHKYLVDLHKYLDASHKYLDELCKYLDALHKYLDDLCNDFMTLSYYLATLSLLLQGRETSKGNMSTNGGSFQYSVLPNGKRFRRDTKPKEWLQVMETSVNDVIPEDSCNGMTYRQSPSMLKQGGYIRRREDERR